MHRGLRRGRTRHPPRAPRKIGDGTVSVWIEGHPYDAGRLRPARAGVRCDQYGGDCGDGAIVGVGWASGAVRFE